MGNDRERKLVSRRKFLSITATGASTLLLAACGGNATTANPTTAQPGANADAGTTTAVEETPAAAGGDVAAEATEVPTPTPAVLGTGGQKVTFWHGLAGADGATFVQMLGTYAQEKPEYSISSELYSTWDVLYQKLPTATAAGTPPDLAIMHSWAIQQFTNQGIIQDADALFFAENLVPKNEFNESLLQTISYEGKTMAVPFDNHGFINWINTKVIQDAGLDPNALPKNGEEFIPWAKKIVVDEAGKHPDEEGFDPERVKIWATHTTWIRFTQPSTIWQFGGDIIGPDGKTSMLDDPKSIAAVQYWNDLIFKHHVVPPWGGGVAENDLFRSNSIAFMWNGTWSLNFFRDNPEAAEVMRPDFVNSFAPDGKQAVRFDSHMLIVPTGVESEKLQGAKDLIVWLSNNGEAWAQSGQVPARTSVQGKETVQGIPSVKVASDQFSKFGRAGQSHPSINEVVQASEAAWSASLAGTTPPEQAMKDADAQIEAVLARG